MFLYAITILVSAFLLFQVQPVIAKIILPWFGGTAAVWTTCLLFFQIVLLLGYLYSHALVRYLKPRAQMLTHAGLLAVSLLALPIYPGAGWKPADPSHPMLRILGLLAVTVGLPYFLLSTTGPLLQAWYARRFKGAMPYRLYALSNAGSMFALLSYPALFEPQFGTHMQATLWSGSYLAFAALCGFVAFRSGSAPEEEAPAQEEEGERPGARLYAMWLLLPACASALLLSITNHLSQNIAAIPFLWVLPLSVYLLSFILCFESGGWYRRNPYLQLLAVALGCMAYSMYSEGSANLPIKVGVPLFLMGLFTCCMVCHGELARLKPHPKYLTHFYVAISAGGALGGVLVGLVAPQVLNGLYELPIFMVACAALALVALKTYPDPDWLGNLLPVPVLPVAAAAVFVAGVFGWAWRDQFVEWANGVAGWVLTLIQELLSALHILQQSWAKGLAEWLRKGWESSDSSDQAFLAAALVLGAALVLAVLHMDPKFRWARKWGGWGAFLSEMIVLTLAGYVGFQMREANAGNRLMVRNFYGALKVHDSGPFTDLEATRTLTHGTINHGEQFLNPARQMLPTTYYGPNTGVGLAIRSKQTSGPIRVGVIGLGTGTTTAYGRQGDYYRVYEINPLVLHMSIPEDPTKIPEFKFLRYCPARHEVAMGDARLSLEREQPENFDVLAVDAFSSDSIPVHLLTFEAMKLFFHHLKPDGILAVHISNRFLDLEPVVKGEADALGKTARTVDTDDDNSQDVFAATWVLVTALEPGFDKMIVDASDPAKATRKVRLWTDDYSNLFQILK